MKAPRRYQVKEVARMTGLSVRTLHHYDELGLLVPSGRTPAGYRLYGDEDLLRLQQILISRELGMPLEEIRRSLDDPRFDRRAALLAQKAALAQRREQADRMLRAVEAALALLDHEGGDTMDRQKIFDGFEPAKHKDEAAQRWGHTDAYKESARRTKSYSESDWKAIRGEQDALYQALADAKSAGKRATDEAVLALAERHRLSIDRWFYPCSHTLHRGLADLYEHDSRFAATIDQYGDGLTPFLAAAIRENARRSGAES